MKKKCTTTRDVLEIIGAILVFIVGLPLGVCLFWKSMDFFAKVMGVK